MVFGDRKGERRRISGRSPRGENIGVIVAIIVIGLFVGRFFIIDTVIVQGKSMLPSFRSGDIVLVFKAAYGLRNPLGGYFFLWGRPKNRHVVAAIKPDDNKTIIKRVWIEAGSGQETSRREEYFLMGDNKYESVDSREFGPVPMNSILGRVLLYPRL